jgi:hypothetical protein
LSIFLFCFWVRILLSSIFQVLGLQTCTTTPSPYLFWKFLKCSSWINSIMSNLRPFSPISGPQRVIYVFVWFLRLCKGVWRTKTISILLRTYAVFTAVTFVLMAQKQSMRVKAVGTSAQMKAAILLYLW